MMTDEKQRCGWVANDSLMKTYHDTVWGVPLHHDQKLFEFIILEAFQAGLSWRTILHKKAHFKQAFAQFNPKVVSSFTEEKKELLAQNTGIIRNKRKISATISNAQAFLKIQKEFGSFDTYIWQFVNNKPIVTHRKESEPPLAKSSVSTIMSKDLKRRGFKFVGPTICYAFMQAVGMVNDHHTRCFRYAEINKIQRDLKG